MNREHDPPAPHLTVNSEASVSPQSARGLRVLLVEDDADSAESMAALLRLRGHKVVNVADGTAALRAAQEDLPDVVLLDIGLPGMDGYGVAKWIGEQPCEKRPLLIAVTGRGKEEDQRRSQAAGIDLHLVKPVDPARLLGLLDRFLAIIR
jgi:CheY-like chemotaxis protein